jgi:Zn-dependent peptidase ImmA (M78 family)
MTAAQRDMALSQGAIALHFNKWLEDRFELPEANLPDFGREPNPEAASESLRRAWGLGELPIRNMIHLLESKGVRVFSLAINAREVDAFSMWRDNTPFVFLNTYKTAEHSRFDAAHELGHLVLHKHGGPSGRQAEIEANAFARAFLMPRASVIAHAPRFPTYPILVQLKKEWRTSVAALNYRLHQLGLMTEWHYRGICIEITQRGRDLEQDEGSREGSLVLPHILDALKEDGFSRSKIAQALAIPQSELEQLLFGLTIASIEGGRKSAIGSPVEPTRLKRVK